MNNETIDIHAHFYPQSYLRLIEREGARYGVSCSFEHPDGPVIDVNGTRTPPLDRTYFDLEARLEAMDEKGVGIHCLSLTQPMVYWAPADLSLRLSQAYNDACAQAHQAYPERYLGLAMLPMLDETLALQELARAARLPGMRGVYMATRIHQERTFQPAFFSCFRSHRRPGLDDFSTSGEGGGP